MPDTNKPIIIPLRMVFIPALFLTIAILSTYWQVRNFDFINFDDKVYISNNQVVQEGLSADGVRWAFSTFHGANWHPVTWLSHLLDVSLYGMDAGKHHVVNLIFHIINTLLCFLLFFRMTNSLWPSAFIAMLFGIHPLHVESVAQVAERKDLLSTFFLFVTVWSYSVYVERPRLITYLITLFLYALGLMSKPMLVTLPFVFFLLDYWPLNRYNASSKVKFSPYKKGRRHFYTFLIMEKMPFIMFSFFSCIITFFAQREGGAVGSIRSYPIDIRIANALSSYVRYLEKMVWPVDLSFFYPYLLQTDLWKTWIYGLVLLFVTLIIFQKRKTMPYLPVGWLWYIGTLVPVIGFVQVGGQSMADRYTYIPLIGPFIMIAWSFYMCGKQWANSKKTLISVLSSSTVVVLMSMTWVQAGYWSNSISLFNHAIKVTEHNVIAHLNLGIVLFEEQKPREALTHFKEIIRIKPRYAEAYNNLGMVYLELGKIDKAMDHLQRALSINPNLEKAHNNMGVALEKKGDYSGAITHYKEALRLNPNHVRSLYNIGVIYYKLEEFEKAMAYFQQVLKQDSAYSDAYNSIGVILFRVGKVNGAIRLINIALQIDPDNEFAEKNLNEILSKTEKIQ